MAVSAAAMVAVTEALPTSSRSTALGTMHALASAVFGGTTQFAIAWLTGLTHDPVTPACYILALVLPGLVAIILFPETAPSRRAQR